MSVTCPGMNPSFLEIVKMGVRRARGRLKRAGLRLLKLGTRDERGSLGPRDTRSLERARRASVRAILGGSGSAPLSIPLDSANVTDSFRERKFKPLLEVRRRFPPGQG